jgi:hypothetical protein
MKFQWHQRMAARQLDNWRQMLNLFVVRGYYSA